MTETNTGLSDPSRTPIFPGPSADVAVIGGGPAGVCAATAAARLGVRVLLVERYGFLGGMASAGMVNPIYGFGFFEPGRQLITGIAEELVEQLRQIEGGTLGHRRREECADCTLPETCRTSGISSLLSFDPEAFKLATYRLVAQAGAELLQYSLAEEAIMQGQCIRGVIVRTKSGRQAIRAEIVVDATGDGDVAAAAGAPCECGRPSDGAVQPQSLMFRIAGVNRSEDRLCFRVDPPIGGVSRILLFRLPRPGEYVVNCDSGLYGCDPLKAEDLTRVHNRAMETAFRLVPWMRQNLEGCAGCHLFATAVGLGVRESRRILGDYVLTKKDVLGMKTFPDAVARANFPLDIHDLSAKPDDRNPLVGLPCGRYYEIPYRCLLPQKVEGLLVAGRCISGTHEAHGSYRVMATCMALGQAAGTAAALAFLHHKSPRQLDAGLLRSTLIQNGVNLK
ncbi:MAG: FAD-dependent oxidoreductase [Pirellulales bacterium]|nr:FAD-dependent oxidoreductase [Pirellulales bacterium]